MRNTDKRHDRSGGPWKTPVIRKDGGEPIGAVVYLTIEDLAALGVDIENEREIYYYINPNEGVRLEL